MYFSEYKNKHNEKFKLDLILLTGDLVNSGYEDEFKQLNKRLKSIRNWLAENKLTDDRIIFLTVPGKPVVALSVQKCVGVDIQKHIYCKNDFDMISQGDFWDNPNNILSVGHRECL